MKLLVCGGRDFRDADSLAVCLEAATLHGGCTEIICGYDPNNSRFQGADQLAYEWATECGLPCRTFPADWGKYGRAAGPIRNQQMAEDGPDECLATPRANGQWGRGTLDMMRRCNGLGIRIHTLSAPPPPTQSEEP